MKKYQCSGFSGDADQSLHWESDSSLIVLNGSERSRLVGGNGGIPRNNNSENITLHSNAERQRGDIEQNQISRFIRSLTSKDSGLDSSTIRNCLVRVDRLVQLTTAEVLRDERLNFWDTS